VHAKTLSYVIYSNLTVAFSTRSHGHALGSGNFGQHAEQIRCPQGSITITMVCQKQIENELKNFIVQT
jgi:hypothetical protein